MLDLIGEKFGELTVTSLAGSHNGYSYWTCQCDCGNTIEVRGTSLTQGKSSQCIKCARSNNGKRNRKDDQLVALVRVYTNYKRQAKQRGLSFEITKEEFSILINSNCFYCNTPPSNSLLVYRRTKDGAPFLYNGIDRVNNDVGYTVDNCVPCCHRCNYSKSNLSVEQFRIWVKTLYLNLFRKITDKTPGELIDTLTTIDIKCFMAQETLCSETDPIKIAEAAKTAQDLNAKRNKVMRSIDALLDFSEDMVTEKSYG